jgi:hypothetical protein
VFDKDRGTRQPTRPTRSLMTEGDLRSELSRELLQISLREKKNDRRDWLEDRRECCEAFPSVWVCFRRSFVLFFARYEADARCNSVKRASNVKIAVESPRSLQTWRDGVMDMDMDMDTNVGRWVGCARPCCVAVWPGLPHRGISSEHLDFVKNFGAKHASLANGARHIAREPAD